MRGRVRDEGRGRVCDEDQGRAYSEDRGRAGNGVDTAVATGVRRTALLLASVVLLLGSAAEGAQEFEKIALLSDQTRPWFWQPDSRSAAMGGAFTAVAEGAAATWWNLGALPMLGAEVAAEFSTREISTFHGDSRVDFLSLAGRTGALGFGFHMTQVHWEFANRTVYDPEGNAGRVDWEDRLLILGAGVDVTRLIGQTPSDLRIGVGLGSVHHHREHLESEDLDELEMDLGFLADWTHGLGSPDRSTGRPAAGLGLRTGYAVQNLLDRNVTVGSSSLKFGRWDRAGVALIGRGLDHPRFGYLLRLTTSIERRGLAAEASESRDPIDRWGAEVAVAEILTFGLGKIWHRIDFDDDDSWTQWGVGLGLRPGNPVAPRFGARIGYAENEFLSQDRDVDQWTLSASMLFR